MDITNKVTWLVKLLIDYDGLSLKEIQQKWLNNYRINDLHKPLPKRTFDGWCEKAETTWGVKIAYDREHNKWLIRNKDSILSDSVARKLFDSISLNEILITNPTLRERVQLEDIPSGKVFLTTFAEAMSDNRLIAFEYRAFDKTEYYPVLGVPYCMKCFERRWYVVIYNEKYKDEEGNGIRLYALDRMRNVNITDKTFEQPKDFSMEKYFREFYGAFCNSSVPIATIRIHASEKQSKYLREIPIHSSQHGKRQKDGSWIFSYRLRPTIDFQQKLMSYGKEVEVLEPQSLRKAVAEQVEAMEKTYKM